MKKESKKESSKGPTNKMGKESTKDQFKLYGHEILTKVKELIKE